MKLAFWYTTVHNCSIRGEGTWLLGRKGVFVGPHWFCGVHSGEVSKGVFLVQTGFFWYIWGLFRYILEAFFVSGTGFSVQNGDFLGTKWGGFWYAPHAMRATPGPALTVLSAAVHKNGLS